MGALGTIFAFIILYFVLLKEAVDDSVITTENKRAAEKGNRLLYTQKKGNKYITRLTATGERAYNVCGIITTASGQKIDVRKLEHQRREEWMKNVCVKCGYKFYPISDQNPGYNGVSIVYRSFDGKKTFKLRGDTISEPPTNPHWYDMYPVYYKNDSYYYYPTEAMKRGEINSCWSWDRYEHTEKVLRARMNVNKEMYKLWLKSREIVIVIGG